MKRKLYLKRETLAALVAVGTSPTVRTCTSCGEDCQWIVQPSCCLNCKPTCGC